MKFRRRTAAGISLAALLLAATVAGQQAVVGTLAGSPAAGFTDGFGRSAQFCGPMGLARAVNLLFVADSGNHVIRQIDLGTGEVTTLAGNGSAGHRDGAPGQAMFDTPRDVVHSPGWGALLVADSGNHMIRAIDLATGTVVTVAGTGTAGWNDGSADAAQFNEPSGLCLVPAGGPLTADRPSQSGDLLIVADTANHCLRMVYQSVDGGGIDVVQPALLVVFTPTGLPGSPGFTDGPSYAAQFRRPIGLSLAPSLMGVLVADTGNHAVRLYDGYYEYVSTIAGDGTPGDEDTPVDPPPEPPPARFKLPAGILAGGMPVSPGADAASQALIEHIVLDTGNSRIRTINPQTYAVTTVAGSVPGYRDAPIDTALFRSPWAMDFIIEGLPPEPITALAFVSDTANHCVRSIGLNTPPTADPGAGYAVGPGDALLLDGTASSDPDIVLGDFITKWAWDLDDDGVFDDALGSTVYLDPVRVWRHFGTPPAATPAGSAYALTIGLQVTDLFGATDEGAATVSVTGDLSDPMRVKLLPEPPWTPGTKNRLEWTASGFAIQYQLQWSRLARFGFLIGSTMTPDLQKTVGNLKHNVTYYYRVRAILSGAATTEAPAAIGGIPGPWSNIEWSTQDAYAPRSKIETPTGQLIWRRTRIPLEWQASESGSGFAREMLFFSHDGGPVTRYPGLYSPSMRAQDTNVEFVLGTIMFDITKAAGDGLYRLFAVGVDRVGNHERIGRTPDLVLIADGTPPAITRIWVLGLTQTTADIGWRTNEPTVGAVEYGTTTAYGSAVGDAALKRSHTVHLTGLRPGTEYHFRIRARDRAANLAVSADHTFRTREPIPPAPILRREPAYTPGTTNTLSWTSVPAVIGYVLWWDTDPGFSSPLSLRTRSTTATVTRLRDGATYFYRVAAINGDVMRGPWSNVESSTQDASPPQSRVALAPAPAAAGPVIHLTPTSSDATSGVRYLLLYFAKDRGAFRRAGPRIPPSATDVPFDASPYGGGHYAFYTTAVDRVGNREAAPATPDVEVAIKLPTAMAYLGDLGTTTGQPALIVAQLADAEGEAVAGARISYTLGTLAGVLPLTDGRGVARKIAVVSLRPGTYDLVLTYTGDATHLPCQAKVRFLVKPLVVAPPAQRVEVRGKGAVVDAAGDRYEFEIDVTNDPVGGTLVIRDVARSKVLRATDLSAVNGSGAAARITGFCSVNGAGWHRFVVPVSDGAPDTLGIITTEGTFVAPTALAAGSITISIAP